MWLHLVLGSFELTEHPEARSHCAVTEHFDRDGVEAIRVDGSRSTLVDDHNVVTGPSRHRAVTGRTARTTPVKRPDLWVNTYILKWAYLRETIKET